MTCAFSWQSSVSLFPASFCTPRLNLPVTSGISLLPTFAFQSPMMKRTFFFWCQFQKVSQVFTEPLASASLALVVGASTWITVILNGLPWNRTKIILSFWRLHPSTAVLTLLFTIRAYSIPSKGFLPTLADIIVI